ncbi:MAG TPA: hypothetical protein VFW40_09505 [Capsulimonadaceae bacterium]|nr:hypothetical protein [Capsulimonadaceae bacterium]
MFRSLSIAATISGLVFVGAGYVQPASSSSPQAQAPEQKRYFPESEFKDLTYDSFLIQSFKKHLTDLDEPILYGQPGVRYALRVTWMTPFYGDAVLRIEDSGERVSFVYKRRPNIGSPDTKRNIDTRGELSRTAFAKLTSEIQREKFFSVTNKQNIAATDGTIWLLEVYNGSDYHAVYRVGPFSTPVQKIGRLAASLAKIDIRKLGSVLN